MRAFLFFGLIAVSAPASAGTRAIYDHREENRAISFEIDDQRNFRAGDEFQYRIVQGPEVYQVAIVDGRPYVARIEDLADALRETTPGLVRTAARMFTFVGADELKRWEKRGKKKVNGFRGREYVEVDEYRSFEEDFDPMEEMDATRVVLSDDPELEPLGDAMLHYTADELYLKRFLLARTAVDEVLRSLDGLARLGTGIGSSEGDIRLVSVAAADIDPARLSIPATPMTRDEIVGLIRARRNPFRF